MGLKVALDSHSNIASPATINSDGNAFQVYIGNPSEFPFLRNRAVQIMPGYENHVEVSGIKIAADPNIVSHSVEDRKCQFYWESELEFHAGYSYTSCVLEFAMTEALNTVRCVPWYMPQVTYLKKSLKESIKFYYLSPQRFLTVCSTKIYPRMEAVQSAVPGRRASFKRSWVDLSRPTILNQVRRD